MPITRLLLCTLSFFTINAAESTLTMSRYYCSNSSTFTPNSAYHANLKCVLDNLVCHVYANKGFLFTSVEANSSEGVYGSLMCKGNVSKKECAECVKSASLKINRVCHMTKVSVLWYNQCMLRYSDANFSSTVEMEPRLDEYNEENIENRDEFMKQLNKTMAHAATKAAHRSMRYGHRDIKFAGDRKLYTFAQCVPDISPKNCSECLRNATTSLLSILKGKIGGRVLLPSCFVQFEIYSFYRSSSKEAATKKFSNNSKLGEGGFGPVHKGALPGGQEIAAKRLSRSSGQGVEEFTTEVEIVAKLQHRNLVMLLEFSMERDETILVYEYVCNGSLDRLLFDTELSGQLDWSACYKVMVGVAHGLPYLHEDSRLQIIHRDLKASNILLDDDSKHSYSY